MVVVFSWPEALRMNKQRQGNEVEADRLEEMISLLRNYEGARWWGIWNHIWNFRKTRCLYLDFREKTSVALWSTSVRCLESPWIISHSVLGLLSRKAGLDSRACGRHAPSSVPTQSQHFPLLLVQKRQPWFGRKEQFGDHQKYLCVFKEVINIERDASLFFRITKCYWTLRFGQVTTFWICQTLCFANGVGFLELLLVGSSAELAVTSQGLSHRTCSPNICSLNDLIICLHFHNF